MPERRGADMRAADRVTFSWRLSSQHSEIDVSCRVRIADRTDAVRQTGPQCGPYGLRLLWRADVLVRLCVLIAAGEDARPPINSRSVRHAAARPDETGAVSAAASSSTLRRYPFQYIRVMARPVRII